MEKSLEISCSQKPSMVLKLISIWFDIISLFVSTMVIFKFIIFPKHWCNPINEIYHILHGFKARGSSKWIQITLVDTNLWKTEKVVTLSTQQIILLLDIFNMGRWILPKKKKKTWEDGDAEGCSWPLTRVGLGQSSWKNYSFLFWA